MNAAAGRVAVVEARPGEAGASVPGVEVLEPAAARQRAGLDADAPAPAVADGLRQAGFDAAVVSDSAAGLFWLDARHARGWVRGVAMPAGFAAAWQQQRDLGWVDADAALLAGPSLPLLSWGEEAPEVPAQRDAAGEPMGLYAIVDTLAFLRAVLGAGIRSVQLRIKQPPDADAAWHQALRESLREGLAAARGEGATLWINDHWRVAAELGADAVHLGQEDLAHLGDAGRAELRATGLRLGVSSHAVWELCRARALAPAYVACGPVWPTTTKDMPWRPQGLDNLAWWCAVAGKPVVAIGGILQADQVRQAAHAGADGVCVLRGLGEDPKRTVPLLQEAFAQGHATRGNGPVAQPHPTLERTA
jgi:hydroxymethylpyrimidine kinase / phosphomethylpyrimidine kinase / thiamine-phosphate diphosphorylase